MYYLRCLYVYSTTTDICNNFFNQKTKLNTPAMIAVNQSIKAFHLSMTGPRSSKAGASSARGSLVSTVVDAMATYLPGLATQCEKETMHT